MFRVSVLGTSDGSEVGIKSGAVVVGADGADGDDEVGSSGF